MKLEIWFLDRDLEEVSESWRDGRSWGICLGPQGGGHPLEDAGKTQNEDCSESCAGERDRGHRATSPCAGGGCSSSVSGQMKAVLAATGVMKCNQEVTKGAGHDEINRPRESGQNVLRNLVCLVGRSTDMHLPIHLQAVQYQAPAVRLVNGASRFPSPSPGPHHQHHISFLTRATLNDSWVLQHPSRAAS